MESHSTCPGAELLERYTVGRTSDAEAQRLDEHVLCCPRCIAQLASLGEGDDLMQALRAQKDKPRPEIADLHLLRERLLGLPRLAAPDAFPQTSSIGQSASPSSGSSVAAEVDVRWLLAPAQRPDEIGRLGPYSVLRVLGTGGMGIVFEGEDSQLKRRVALKAMHATLGASSIGRQRFLHEAQRMAALTHDHILTIHHVGEERTVPFLAMPLLQGELLEDRLMREGRLPVNEALRIGRETALGLVAAHERGVIHRDIKPANLWLEAPSGRVKILDFGLARLSEGDAGLTDSGAIVGTPCYMAPEQAEGEVDPRADLFSLGCVLYRMVTGQHAFPAKTPTMALRAIATLEPLSPRQIDPETPEPLNRLIELLLSKDRARRPESATAVVQALVEIERAEAIPKLSEASALLAQKLYDNRTLPERPPSNPTPSTPSDATDAVFSRRRQRWLWFLAAVLLLAGVLAVASLTRRRDRHSPTGLEPVPDKPQVLRLEVKHFATVKGRRDPRARLLGKDSFVTHCEDSVEVDAWLSRPAYAFLIAFRPDGTQAVCFPEKDDEAPPTTDRPRFPSVSTDSDYALEEGAGLHVFAVVVSSQKLPPFKEWWSQQGCPWQKSEAPPDVVWLAYAGAEVEELTANPGDPRGKREVPGKASVVRLRNWLSKRPQVEDVAVLGFAVLPKGKQ